MSNTKLSHIKNGNGYSYEVTTYTDTSVTPNIISSWKVFFEVDATKLDDGIGAETLMGYLTTELEDLGVIVQSTPPLS